MEEGEGGGLSERQVSTADARRRLEDKGVNYRNIKNGNSLLHDESNTTPSAVFIATKAGVNVNMQNFDGDSSLHLAVKKGNLSTARALLMSGADPNLRNKLGQNAWDLATTAAIPAMKKLLHQFRPGLVTAVSKAEPAAIQRLTNLWVNPNATIKDGKSALQLLHERKKVSECACRCYNYIQEHISTLEMVHAVLANDVDGLRHVLETRKNWNCNVRYCNKLGMTPLSCAVDHDNLEMVQILVQKGNAAVNVRVRETENEDLTVPLYFKTLDSSCSEELWHFLAGHVDDLQDGERDPDGNTAVFRAIANGKSAAFITALLEHKKGANITDRNMNGDTPRDAAERLGRSDISRAIDEYLFQNSSRGLLMDLPLSFYGKEQLNVCNKDGSTLLECAVDGKNENDIQASKNYTLVEKQGRRLFESISSGDLRKIAKYNTAIYRDKNGFTALTRAVLLRKPHVVELLITERPQLRLVPDNRNRYPLHYAYLIPGEEGSALRKVLLRSNPGEIERRVDMYGRLPAEYTLLYERSEADTILEEASNLLLNNKMSDSTLPTPMPSAGMTPNLPEEIC